MSRFGTETDYWDESQWAAHAEVSQKSVPELFAELERLGPQSWYNKRDFYPRLLGEGKVKSRVPKVDWVEPYEFSSDGARVECERQLTDLYHLKYELNSRTGFFVQFDDGGVPRLVDGNGHSKTIVDAIDHRPAAQGFTRSVPDLSISQTSAVEVPGPHRSDAIQTVGEIERSWVARFRNMHPGAKTAIIGGTVALGAAIGYWAFKHKQDHAHTSKRNTTR